VFSDTINTGIYVLEPEIFEHIPDGQPADFAGDVFPKLLEGGAPLFGFVADGYWEDVGSLEAYQRAHQDILDGKVKVDVRGFQVRPGIWLGEGAEVDPDAVLTAPLLIGDFTKVEAGARLREYTVVGSGVIVKRDAFLHRAIVHDNAYIGPGTSLRGCVVGRSADVKRGGRSATTPTSATGRSFNLMSRSIPIRRSNRARSSPSPSSGRAGAPAGCSASAGWPASATST
jgi:mannose-1-phosphate guanylyltransferase/phosphomannomutase